MSELETLIRTLVRRELDARETQQPAGTLIGTVVGVPDTSRYMLVTIGGSDKPVPVWRPALPTPPVAGDRIAMARGPEGYLVVTSVLDRDPDVLDIPDPTDGLTLDEYEALGLVTRSSFESHIDSPLHLHPYNTPNTYDAYDGWWTRIGSGVIPEQWGSVAFHVELNGAGSNGTTWTRGTIRGRIRQQAAMTDQPTVRLELDLGRDIAAADVALVVTSVADATLLELHLRLTREYEWAEFIPIWTRTDRADWTWSGCNDFTSTLPVGTVTTAAGIGASSGSPAIAGTVLTGTGLGTSEWLPPFDRAHDHSSALDGATLAVAGGFNVTSILTPAPFTGDVNNYDPNGGDLAFLWRLDANGATRNVTGIAAPTVGGALHWLTNLDAGFAITLKHNSGSSSVGNRFYLPNNSDMVVSGSDSVLILYDATSAAWIALGGWA